MARTQVSFGANGPQKVFEPSRVGGGKNLAALTHWLFKVAMENPRRFEWENSGKSSINGAILPGYVE